MPVGPVDRDELTAEFFDGTARGEFLLRRCTRCATVAEPASQQCPACESTALDWVPAAGDARLVSWAVVHGRPSPDGERSRTVVAIGELAEGPWWWGPLLAAAPEELQAGQPLRIAFEPVEGHETVPAFRLA